MAPKRSLLDMLLLLCFLLWLPNDRRRQGSDTQLENEEGIDIESDEINRIREKIKNENELERESENDEEDKSREKIKTRK